MLNDVRDQRAPVADVAGGTGVTDRPPGRPAFASHEVIPGDPGRGLVIVCDHALNDLPPGYGTLGLPASALQRHIAYDIGVEPVTRLLAGRLGAPAVLAGFSRLLIDPNRGLDDPTLIMQISDGTIVPDNVGLDPKERERRIALYYRAYHDAIDGVLDAAMASGRPPAVLSIHSFTPTWRGIRRPWQAGVLWNYDGRFALPLIDRLRGLADLEIGDNEPYAGGLKGDTLDVHATGRGLADALIEIRQDLVGNAPGVAEWVERLAALLPDIIDRLG